MNSNEFRNSKVATGAAVHASTAINVTLIIPAVCYFTLSINSNMRHTIVEKVMEAVIACGVRLTDSAFDRHASKLHKNCPRNYLVFNLSGLCPIKSVGLSVTPSVERFNSK